MTCIRTPGSTWTACKCEPCRAEMARKAKHRRNGHPINTDQRDAAWTRLTAWVERGYAGGAIANHIGLSGPATRKLIANLREGNPVRMKHETARRILAAPDRPTNTPGWIPSSGTVRRLRALAVMGWSLRELERRSGIASQTLSALRDPKHSMTTPKFAEAVRALYDDLSMMAGPSNAARNQAARGGWHGPLAWDDDRIDDPDATPDMGAAPDRVNGGTGRRAIDVVEDCEWLLLHDPSLTSAQLAHRLGYTGKSSIQHALDRAGRPDLLARLARNAEAAA